ncbi:DUF2970 domain-containing protein [Marinobacter lutaoensis]|jgi:hypothetical protein|uniref:DUF2970 domain-containing protein n=1 Tax=Marinobacter lutaoensis TaxID=135739 RepID=A0A1V2DU21_9GAMM|nr:DUF2970 domain-containing protein [Marinobacter lutaoensis]MBE02968.1 DUF2970 domain-containing protein [Marinobacter sp.]MBI42754.1 DUF2970 domain-containing protein [Oceanospirillales bacterium]NVD35185.1 DUF2970 domain-containing protein [Marinobacter lutaoensis]ONF44178.1 hypothetical protein BTO32_07815 [Marinobacter lutaoensis]|tara:strand:+ start:679 stop:909 length:231 start_codon:yes stop_codon:yes gene_type:complete
MTQETENDNNRRPRSPGVLKILQSILAGAFGVQSDRRRQEDFASHSPWPYIVAGLLFTAAFVVGLILVVQVVLAGH